MLIRSSRGAEVLTKEAFVGSLVGKSTRGFFESLGKDIRSLGKGYQAQKSFIGPRLKGQTALGQTIKEWAPTTMVGKGVKTVGRGAAYAAKHPFGTIGVAGGAYMGGSALSGGVQSAMAQHRDPHALQRRRMQGFRS